MKKEIVLIKDLESLSDWYFELTLIKGYSDFDAFQYMALQSDYKAMIQLSQKLQLDRRLINRAYAVVNRSN